MRGVWVRGYGCLSVAFERPIQQNVLKMECYGDTSLGTGTNIGYRNEWSIHLNLDTTNLEIQR